MTDMEQLAAQLVEAAAQAHDDANVAWMRLRDGGPIRYVRARHMATALLRELAAAEITAGVGTFDALADFIEKGQNNGA